MAKQHTSNKVIVETILATGMTHAAASEMFGKSERWIGELMRRYRTGGFAALEPRSKAPKTHPNQIPADTRARILELREQLINTGFDAGAHTIRYHLEQQNADPLPAAATIHRILKQAGLITPQPQKRPRSSWHRFEAAQPNETWQLDYSNWALADATCAHILTILDDHSRFIIACTAFPAERLIDLIDTFIQAGNHHGYPQSTLTDNGSTFTTKLHRTADTRNGFEQLLLEMGIKQKNGAPYHPQTQGKVEPWWDF